MVQGPPGKRPKLKRFFSIPDWQVKMFKNKIKA